MRIHLDTDLGSDTDDACALAMLLGWPDLEIVGITTTIDPGGIRAGYVHRCLELAGRTGIAVRAGAEVSLTTLITPGGIPDDERYWRDPVVARPSPPGEAMDLLHASLESGATVVAIGPYTNLGMLEAARPGTLGLAPVVVMGGCVGMADEGLPAWGPQMDWNVQCDTRAAQIVFERAELTVADLPVTLKAHLRGADLERLRDLGPLGALLAAQAVAHAADSGMADLARAHPGLPDDLLNFQYDAVACAVAAAWPGAPIAPARVTPILDGDILRLAPSERGRAVNLLVDIDAAAFRQAWFDAVSKAHSPSPSCSSSHDRGESSSLVQNGLGSLTQCADRPVPAAGTAGTTVRSL